MTLPRMLWRVGNITPGGMIGLLLLTSLAGSAGAGADRTAGEETGRRRIPLADGWLVKQLDSDRPDIATLVRQSQAPDKTWLSARMPAQVHDILLVRPQVLILG